MAAITIRPATIADDAAIAEVHVLSWQHAYRGLLPDEFLASLSVPRRQAKWAEALVNGHPSLLVAEANGRVIGFSAFAPCRGAGAGPADYELWAIYLVPSHWSAGLGRQLWLQSNEAMVSQGATRVTLWVLAGNGRAIRFYTAAGFRAEPGSDRVVELGGVKVREVRYVRQYPASATASGRA